ncbi:BMP family ABC transporter substrate-binding protein [Pseudogemmobacter sonorensis]|uniref:BMP family ABC transporter substrate-binding protein n=1 Tax=Pseudogemmobacter sonorensis TaxID=2989681 RepID=UPI00367D17A3
MRTGVLFVGELRDRGFNASALQGAEALAREGVALEILSGIPYDRARMRAAIDAALPRLDALVFVGGQGDAILPDAARDHPGKRFVALQGAVSGANLGSYDVLQEQSAFLAGCLAARLTRSGTVAHLSGHRVKPGLKGRAAFAAGVAHIDPGLRLLTGFCGTQDDNAVTRAWAGAQIAAGADILFTMLNGARSGAVEACRAGAARQIGNALDWVAMEPDVFVASAEARIDLGLRAAIADLEAGDLPAAPRAFGLAEGAVGLRLRNDVPAAIRAEIAAIARLVESGEIAIPEEYDGPEFHPEESHAA